RLGRRLKASQARAEGEQHAMSSGSGLPAASRPGLLRALRHVNYRRFFLGQGVSLLGTWMQQTALAWLVLRVTDDAFLMGLNTFAGQIPWLLFLPVAGGVLDRWDRLRLVLVRATLAMRQAFLLAALVLRDWVAIGL